MVKFPLSTFQFRGLLTAAQLICVLSIHAQKFSLRIADSALRDTITTLQSTRSDALDAARHSYYEILDAGYILAEADTIVSDSVVLLTIRRNERCVLDGLLIYDGDARQHLFKSSDAISQSTLFNGFGNALKEYENKGYPFAAIRIDSIQSVSFRKKNVTSARVFASIIKGPLILNDSLHIRSSQALPSVYMKNYIDFRKGDVYNEQRIQQTERRLREIPFVLVKRPPEVRFHDGKADLFLFVERKKANYFNGIAGLRPDELTGKVNVTGDAEIRLLNAFNRGEEFGLVWRKLQPLTQDLSIRTMVPYLFKSPLAIDGRLQIYKRDTSFTSVKLIAGLGLLLPRNQRLRVFVERNRTDRLTSFYTAGVLANAQQTLYGINTQFSELDYRWNPRKGYALQLEGATGYRIASNTLSDNETTLRLPISRVEFQTENYIPVFKRQTILIASRGGAMFSDSLYENEVYRIGGLRTIRGINEESIFATAWGVGTLEYRWLFEENSALYLFIDQAWYEYKSARGYVRDVPINAGAGFNFETKAGIFTFNYALGKQFDNPVLLRNGKISFGFRSLF